MQWFIKEQVEEVATMSDLLRVVEPLAADPHGAAESTCRARDAARRGPARSPRGEGQREPDEEGRAVVALGEIECS